MPSSNRNNPGKEKEECGDYDYSKSEYKSYESGSEEEPIKSSPQPNDMFGVFSNLKTTKNIGIKARSSDTLMFKNRESRTMSTSHSEWDMFRNDNDRPFGFEFEPSQYLMFNGPLNSIAPNPNLDLLAVAGREVLKVIKLNPTSITEYLNLRVGYRLNLNFSSNDVTWGIGYSQDKLSTASTNGSVVLWDLNKTGQKIERLLTEHSRAVNKVKFNPTNGHLLFSAAQDGLIKAWDIRTKDSAKFTFNPNSDAVRDFQFNPIHSDEFVAAFESGSIQVWDIRNPTTFTKKFTAHTGIALTVDWNADGRTVASGGRDKLIKIWDTKSDSRKPNGLIQTIAPVSKVRWRPSHLHQLASISLNNDYSINVWDINRPYLPKYTILGHRNVTTDMAWAGASEIFSCSKDHYFLRRPIGSQSFCQPNHYLSSTALAWNPFGDISFVLETSDNQHTTQRLPLIKDKSKNNKAKKNVEHLFRVIPAQTSGVLHVPTFDFRAFNYFANNYSLDNKDLIQTCENNYLVAYHAEHFRAAQTWKVIQMIWGNFTEFEDIDGSESDEDMFNNAFETIQNRNKESPQNINHIPLSANLSTHSIQQIKNKTKLNNFIENEELPDNDYLLDAVNLIDRLSDVSEDELKESNNNLSNLNSTAVSTSTATPAIPTQSNTPGNRSPRTRKTTGSSNLVNSTQANNKMGLFNQFPNNWKPESIIDELIDYYLNEGDVQMCCIILIILSNKTNINKNRIIPIFKGYIELLHRFKMYTLANEIIKNSKYNEILIMNQESTTFYTMCSKCKKPLMNQENKDGNSYCNNCLKIKGKCSLCNTLVKGIFIWCHSCNHGGHLNCFKKWFDQNQVCPTGCGHVCNLSG